MEREKKIGTEMGFFRTISFTKLNLGKNKWKRNTIQ